MESVLTLAAGVAGLWLLSRILAEWLRPVTRPHRLLYTLLLFTALPSIAVVILGTIHIKGLNAPVWLLGLWTAAGLGYAAWRRTAGKGQRLPCALAPCLRAAWEAGWRSRLLWGAVGLLFLTLAAVAWHLPPRFADALLYHLLHPIRWCQEQQIVFRLGADALVDPWGRAEGTPKLLESLAYLLMCLSGSVSTAALAQLPALALGIVSLAALGARLGLSPAARAIAALIFLLTPEVLLQSTDVYVDVAMTAAVLCVIELTLELLGLPRQNASPNAGLFFAYGIALGCVAGLKPTGPLLAAALLAGAMALTFARRDTPFGAAIRLRLLAAGAGGCLLLAGPWFLLNGMDYKNPIFPYAFRLGSVEIFRGPLSSEINIEWLQRDGLTRGQAWVRAWTESELGSSIGARYSGLGAIFFVLGIPALLAATLGAARRRDCVWLVLLGLAVLVFLATPDRWWPRFVLILPAAAALCLAAVLEAPKVSRAGRIALTALLVLGGAWNLLRVIPAVPGILLSPPTWSLELTARSPSPLMNERRSSSYTCMDWVREELSSYPGRLLVVGGGIPGALYPDDFGRLRLDTLSAGGRDAAQWIEAVLERGTTHLLFTTLLPAPPREYEWVAAHPERFERVMSSLTGGGRTAYDRERPTHQEVWRVKPHGRIFTVPAD